MNGIFRLRGIQHLCIYRRKSDIIRDLGITLPVLASTEKTLRALRFSGFALFCGNTHVGETHPFTECCIFCCAASPKIRTNS